ncbi:MAG: GAF domain-containing protein, partial [Phototrophicaceae bacterium]
TPNLESIAQMADPADNFLALFAGERQTSFQFGKRWIEASSHRIPAAGETRTVVVMRELAGTAHNPDLLDLGLAMSLVNEIGEAVHAGMSVEQILQVLLTIIGQAVPFEAGEVCLWDEKDNALYPRGWVGDAFYVLALAEAGGRYEMDEGVTGWIARHRQPVLLNSREEFAAVQPKLLDSGYQSIVAVPLMLGGRFTGTLEIASKEPHYYTPGHQALLQAISTPVAVAIHNAELYAEQVQRLDSLAGLHQVVSQDQLRSRDARPVYESLTARIAELADAEMCGILLYDRDRGGLVPQLPFYGLPEALVTRLFIPLPENSPQRDIWENQSYWVSNDVTDEQLVEALGLRHIVDVAGIANTAWIPLRVGQGQIGVVAISNRRTPGGFNNRDIQNMAVLASQAAVVVEGVRLYQREQRMDTELVGLQEITNAIGALSHEADFYGEITERIAGLMDMEICGVLLYDAEGERLVSKSPFYGVSDELVAAYTVPLPPGSIMAELWTDEPYWFSNRVESDPLVFEAGLDEMAGQMGVTRTLMAVLQASGRKLGVVQVANKRSGQDFNDGDARLLMIFATQAAAIIENARLFQEAQRSAEQAQGLRRIAELAGNVLTAQESFTPVLDAIATLMDVDVIFVNVLDQPQGVVITYPRWVYGHELDEPIVQDIFAPGFEYSVVVSHQPYLSNDLHDDPNLLDSYRDIAQRLDLRSAVVVPLNYTDRTLGEMGIANRRGRPFDQSDLDIMKAVASQIAAALDRLLLYQETGQNLTQRLEELDAISRVSNELTITLDLDQILDVICKESVATLRAQSATVVLFRPFETWSAPNRPEVERRLGGDDSMPELADVEREAVDRGDEAVVVQDYEFSLFNPAPASASSALAVTIQYLDQPVGVIHLYHTEASVFDERSTAFIETMAVKAALGYGNAIRYREQLERGDRLRRRVEQLNSIFELGHLFQSTANPVDVLEAIAYSVQDSVGFDTILMLLVDDDAGCLRRVAHAGLPVTLFEASRAHTIALAELESLLREDYHISESYFFPAEQAEDWTIDGIQALSTAFEGSRTLPDAGGDNWRDGDLFAVTMRSTAGDLIGLMCLDRPYNNRRPDRGTVEVLEIFAHQAARTIENMRLYRSTVRSAELEAQLNEVMEAVSSTLDIAQIVQAVAHNVRRIVPFNRLTISVRDAEDTGFDVLRVVVGEGDDLDVQRDRREMLGQSAVARSYEDGQDYLYHASDAAASDYEDLRAWVESGEQTSLVLPMLTGGECMGTVHLGSNQPDEAGFTAYRPLLRRMAQLVAGAVQNARLFTQAINLQVLNESVVESIQQAIIVLDDTGQIILSNSFMQERFGWPVHSADQHLFDYRPELRDLIGDDLTAVLATGAPRERINQTLTAPDADGPLVMSFYLYPLRAADAVRGAVILVEDVTERALLELAMQARAEQLAALTEISNRITSSLERDEVIQMALTKMGELVEHNGMTLWRRHGSSMVLQGSTGELVDDSQPDYTFTFGEYPLIQQMIESQRALAVNEPSQLTHEIPLHAASQSWMGLPLVNQFHVVGMVMLSHTRAGAYENPSDHHVGFAFASQVAIALANADLFEQTFDRTNELSTLLEAAQATSMTTDLNTVLRNVVDLMFGALGVEACSIMIWDEVDNSLEVQLERNTGDDPTQVLPRG